MNGSRQRMVNIVMFGYDCCIAHLNVCVSRNFSRGGNINILLISVRLLTMQWKCTFAKRCTVSTRLHHKENAPCYDNIHKKCASLAAIATYFTIIFTTGYLQITKQGTFHRSIVMSLTKPQIMTLFHLARLINVT